MSWSQTLRRVGYSASLALAAGLVFWAANQTLLATDHVELSQVSPNAVTATANQPVRSWNHVFGSSSMTDCTTASYSNSNEQVSAARTRTITWTTGSRRDGNYLCVRTLVDTANREYAYSSPLRIDLAGPTIRFESGRSAADSIQATINDYNNLHSQAGADTEILATEVVSGASFRYAILNGSADCSVRNLNLRTVDTDLTRTSTTANNFTELKVNVPVVADNHGQYVCLKTTDAYGNVSYQSSTRLDTTVERVRLSVSNNQVRLVAGEILTSVWGEASSATSCSTNAPASPANAQGVTSLSVSYADGDATVCFYMVDRQSNAAFYSYTLDTEDPSIPVTAQSGRIVIATSSDTDQRDSTQQGDNDYPKDWGIDAWHSYFIDSASTDLATTLGEACDAEDYGKSGTDSASQTWRVYSTRSSSNRLTLSSSHSRYKAVCFRATDYSGRHNYGHIILAEYEASDPVISGQRSNFQAEVTLSLSSTSKRATSWRWAKIDITSETCNLALIGSATPTTSNKLPVTADDIGDLFCVEVLLNDNSRIYQIVEAGDSQIDDTAPVIDASWARNSLRATATDDLSGVKSTTWQWQIITDPANAESSCQPDDDANPKITSWRRGSNTGTLGTSRNGQFICFRVSDNVGNTGYASFEIEVVSRSTDTTRPVVNVRRNGKTVTASSPSSDLPSVPDWRYVISSSSACDDNVFTNAGSNLGYGNSVQLVDGDDVWVCFQVTDSANNAGHKNIRVDLAGPTITVSQSGTTATASADETASGWIYFRSDNYPHNCNPDAEFNFNQRPTFVGRTVRNLTQADVGKWLCFRATDSHNNQGTVPYQITGPIGQPVQTQPLTISFTQTQTQLTANGSRAVASWSYLVYESAPTNCNGDNTYFDSDFAGNSNIVDLVAADDGRYYCFQAKAADGTEAHASHLVNLSTSPSTTPTPVTPTQPTQPVDAFEIEVDQADNQLTASANRTVTAWRYLIYINKPADCNDKNTYFAADNGRIGRSHVVNLEATDEGRYYCFEATDADDNKAYYLHQVEAEEEPEAEEPEPTPAPIVSIHVDRQGNQLIASSDHTIRSWKYLIYASKPICNDKNTYFDTGSTNLIGKTNTANLGPSSVGRYYCFRGKATNGQLGYALHQVTRPVAGPVDEETTTTQPPETEQPVAINPVEVSIRPDGRHLVASANQPIAQWRYLVYTTEPSCDDDNTYFNGSGPKVGRGNRAALVDTSNDRYYCFRAKTADNRTGYAIARVPASADTSGTFVFEIIQPEPVQQTQPAEQTQTPTQQPAETTQAPEPEQPGQPATTTRTTVINVHTGQTAAPAEADDEDEEPAETTTVPETDKPLPVDDTTTTTTDRDDGTTDGTTGTGDEDDDLPWPWIIGGVAAAVLIILLVFRPRRDYDDEADDSGSHDLNL